MASPASDPGTSLPQDVTRTWRYDWNKGAFRPRQWWGNGTTAGGGTKTLTLGRGRRCATCRGSSVLGWMIGTWIFFVVG